MFEPDAYVLRGTLSTGSTWRAIQLCHVSWVARQVLSVRKRALKPLQWGQNQESKQNLSRHPLRDSELICVDRPGTGTVSIVVSFAVDCWSVHLLSCWLTSLWIPRGSIVTWNLDTSKWLLVVKLQSIQLWSIGNVREAHTHHAHKKHPLQHWTIPFLIVKHPSRIARFAKPRVEHGCT